MTMKISKVGIVSRDDINKDVITSLTGILTKYGIEYTYSPVSAVANDEIYVNSDVIISLGGDGTLLAAADRASLYGKPVMGVNHGYLGFLSELEKDAMSGVDKLFTGSYKIDERMMLECRFVTENQEKVIHCLNDVIISRGAFPRMIQSRISVNGSVAEEYTSDGIIVSSPTGSTAYSLSAGGPILSPELEIMSITPICPHSLNNRSLIVGALNEIEIRVNETYNDSFFVSCDGGINQKASGCVTVRKSEYKARLIRVNDESFYSILRKKFSERGV